MAAASTEENLDLLLIGKTGNGKSKTGNMILGCDAFPEGSGCESVTRTVSTGVVIFNGREIKVVDSPGVGDTVAIRDVERAAELTIDSMKAAITLNPKGYHAFLLVFRYGTRFTTEDFECIRLLKNIFGEDFVKQFCILVVTHGDVFAKDPKYKDKNFMVWCLDQKGAFKDLLTECNNRVVLFDNSSNNKATRNLQVAKLLILIDDIQHRSKRYSFENFRYTEKSRKIILVKAKEPKIRDDAMNKLRLFLNDYENLKHLHDLTQQKSITENRLNEIQMLYEYLVFQDNETGTLGDLMTIIFQVGDMFESKIDSISELLEANSKLETERREHQNKEENLNRILNKLQEEQKIEHENLVEEIKKMDLESKEKENEIRNLLEEEEKKRNEALRTEKEKHQYEMERLQKERDHLKKNKKLGERERKELEKQYQKNEQQLKKTFDVKVNDIKLQMEIEKRKAQEMLELEKDTLQTKHKKMTDKYKKENEKLELLIQDTITEKDNLCLQLEETKQKNKELENEFQMYCLKHDSVVHKKEMALTKMKRRNYLLLDKLQKAEEANAHTLESKLKDLQQRYLNNKGDITQEEIQLIKNDIDILKKQYSVLHSTCSII